jgi:putative DNA primase/helicase
VMIGKTWQVSKALSELNPDKLVFTAGDLLLAAQDISGEIRSVQAIQENGLKRFVAGGVKQAMFHVVGGQGLEALNKAPSIVIAEGYATADTVSQALGYATVAAFDSGNLLNVAQQLREKFPHKPFIIAGDNDVHVELTEGKNPGKEKALAAAKVVDGTAIFPIFAPDEQSYPDNLEPVTPLTARSGGLTNEQQAAITKMKRYTDFNDLVTNSVLGREGLERQVTTRVNNIIESRKEQLVVKHEQELFVKCEQQQHRQAIKM